MKVMVVFTVVGSFIEIENRREGGGRVSRSIIKKEHRWKDLLCHESPSRTVISVINPPLSGCCVICLYS